MPSLKELLNEGDRFAATSGIRLTEIRQGYAKAEMDVEERHLNAAGVCQGGALFTLADLTFAAVANSHGPITLGVQNSVHFLASARLGDHLTAEGREIQDHHRLPFCEMRVTDQNGRLLCVITGTAYRKKERFPFDTLDEPSLSTPAGEEDAALFEELRAVRKEMAQEQNVPAFIILSDKTLHALAAEKPTTLEAFGRVHGIGQHKKDTLGERFVALINKHHP